MMREWHVTPDYIANNWTEELITLMLEKLVERKERERMPPSKQKVPEQELFARGKNLIKVVKRGD